MTTRPTFQKLISRRQMLAGLLGVFALSTYFVRGEDDRPVVNDRAVTKEKAALVSLPTLWIADDSTLKSNAPMRGWAQDLGTFFDPKKINVVNRAIGSRSSRTFFNEGKWKAIEGALKPGDFVIIQFGHNDVGPLDERGRRRRAHQRAGLDGQRQGGRLRPAGPAGNAA